MRIKLILALVFTCSLFANAEPVIVKVPMGKVLKGDCILVSRDQEIEQSIGINPIRLWELSEDLVGLEYLIQISYSEKVNKYYEVKVGFIIIDENGETLKAVSSFELNPKVANALMKNELYIKSDFSEIVLRANGLSSGGVLIIKKETIEELKSNTKVSEFSPLWKWLPTKIQ